MYRTEVPLYGDLMDIVREINSYTLQDSDRSSVSQGSVDEGDSMHINPERLSLERHGAIRVGTSSELRTIARVFALLGMHPVGYYDLSIAGLPMHATCFRPTDIHSLERNPFRVFTTLLRPDLIASDEARELSLTLLNQRKISSNKLLELVSTGEIQGRRLTPNKAEIFIPEALTTFSWQPVAAATYDQYEILKTEHPIMADIACFRSVHINHLTPRTLDISAVQSAMKAAGMDAKSRIEGPPGRKCPILLGQTSFLALEEPVKFYESNLSSNGGDDSIGLNISKANCTLVQGSHKARFGEVEQLGAALTSKVRALYHKLIQESWTCTIGMSPEEADVRMGEIFQKYPPDTWTELRRQGHIYCQFRCIKMDLPIPAIEEGSGLERLISSGVVEAVPITCEDFLPLSAAGIFSSQICKLGLILDRKNLLILIGHYRTWRGLNGH